MQGDFKQTPLCLLAQHFLGNNLSKEIFSIISIFLLGNGAAADVILKDDVKLVNFAITNSLPLDFIDKLFFRGAILSEEEFDKIMQRIKKHDPDYYLILKKLINKYNFRQGKNEIEKQPQESKIEYAQLIEKHRSLINKPEQEDPSVQADEACETDFKNGYK